MLPVSTEWQPTATHGARGSSTLKLFQNTNNTKLPLLVAHLSPACERYVGSLLWYLVEGSTQGQQVFGVKDSLRQPHSDTAAPCDATLFDGLLPL